MLVWRDAGAAPLGRLERTMVPMRHPFAEAWPDRATWGKLVVHRKSDEPAGRSARDHARRHTMSLLRKFGRMWWVERCLMGLCAAAISFTTARLLGTLVVSQWPAMLVLWGLLLFPLAELILAGLVVVAWLAARQIDGS
jgi:hypothetical protein